MKTRHWVLVVLALSAFWLMPSAEMAHAAELRRPNLVFIYSDQHSADMLGCYGNRDLITPSFDRLASQGVRFTHCISNSPVCTPFRGMRDARPYVRFVRQFVTNQKLALADASARWEHLWKEGIPYTTYLHNYYNHPDDRGHRLFAEELMRCFDPVATD